MADSFVLRVGLKCKYIGFYSQVKIASSNTLPVLKAKDKPINLSCNAMLFTKLKINQSSAIVV